MNHKIAQFPPVVGGLSKFQKTEGAAKKSRSNPAISAQKRVFRCGKHALQKTLQHFGTRLAYSLFRGSDFASSQNHILCQSVPSATADSTAAFNREAFYE